MGTLGWTPAAQLATQNMEGAARSYASMDKAVNQTQTTKVSGYRRCTRKRGRRTECRDAWRAWRFGGRGAR